VAFECIPGGRGFVAPIYFDSYAPLVSDAIRRLLKPGDVFFDVGANVGYLSAIAAGIVGIRGQVHAFEPAPEYFAQLKRLAELNPAHSIFANPCAAGEKNTVRTIYLTREAGQNTLVSHYKGAIDITATQQVRVVRLDSYIEEEEIERIALIKIDVEGYELNVLKGLERYFRRAGHRPPIICEVAPRAYPLMATALSDLARYMKSFGYSAFDVADGASAVDVCAMRSVDDVLFLARAA
jgi:FkbM family methyltransferase